MERIKVLLPGVVAIALLLSLFFVNGSFAEPLGAGLLQRFGVSSSGTDGTQAATRGFDLPVTVTNPSNMPVPVTVQGTNSQPLTATIDGTVNANATISGVVDMQDINDPSAQPFQQQILLVASSGPIGGNKSTNIAVPAQKRLIIRYVSAWFDTSPNAVASLELLSTVNGQPFYNFIPVSFVERGSLHARHQFGLETWITADPGSDVEVVMQYDDEDINGGPTLQATISGYLVDVPTTP